MKKNKNKNERGPFFVVVSNYARAIKGEIPDWCSLEQKHNWAFSRSP
jgi:hypothetical protein